MSGSHKMIWIVALLIIIAVPWYLTQSGVYKTYDYSYGSSGYSSSYSDSSESDSSYGTKYSISAKEDSSEAITYWIQCTLVTGLISFGLALGATKIFK